MAVLEKVKGLLKITVEDPMIDFTVDLVTEEVLNYCNLIAIPEKLENVVVMMCIDNLKQSGLQTSTDNSNVKSIKEGDTTIQYVSSTEMVLERVKSPSFMFNYTAQLNRFRKSRL